MRLDPDFDDSNERLPQSFCSRSAEELATLVEAFGPSVGGPLINPGLLTGVVGHWDHQCISNGVPQRPETSKFISSKEPGNRE